MDHWEEPESPASRSHLRWRYCFESLRAERCIGLPTTSTCTRRVLHSTPYLEVGLARLARGLCFTISIDSFSRRFDGEFIIQPKCHTTGKSCSHHDKHSAPRNKSRTFLLCTWSMELPSMSTNTTTDVTWKLSIRFGPLAVDLASYIETFT